MVGTSQACIRTDYVAIVGTSQDFGVLYNAAVRPKGLARATWNNVAGLTQVFTGVVQDMLSGPSGPSGDYLVESGREQLITNTDYGNKMMFAAQGIRGLRMNSDGADYKTLIYYSTGYTQAQRAAIEEAAERHGSPDRIFAISTTEELIDLLNEPNFPTEPCDRKILRIDIYTHGLPDDLSFGYEGHDKELLDAQRFRAEHAAQLDSERYNPPGRRSHIYSWGCRTAISNRGITGGLAKAMAESTGAIAHGHARRTEYTNTWNTGSQSAEEAGLIEIDSGNSLVLWHPDGAMRGVIEGISPEENPAGKFIYDGLEDGDE